MRVALSEDLGQVVATVDPHFPPETQGDPPRQWKSAAPTPNASASYADRRKAGRRYCEGEGQDGDLREGVDTVLARGRPECMWPKIAFASRRLLSEEQRIALTARRSAGRVRARSRGLRGRRPTGRLVCGFPRLGSARAPVEFADALGGRADRTAAAEPPRRTARRLSWSDLPAALADSNSFHLRRRTPRSSATETRRRVSVASRYGEFSLPPTAMRCRPARGRRRDLYEIGVAFARATTAGKPRLSRKRLGAAGWRRSTLIGLIKQVEHWIVQPADYDGDWPTDLGIGEGDAQPSARQSLCRGIRSRRGATALEATLDLRRLDRARDRAGGGKRRVRRAQRNYDAALARGVAPLPLDPTAALGRSLRRSRPMSTIGSTPPAGSG